MENTTQLSTALKDMQDKVIGLFRPRFYPADQYIPVIEHRDGVLTCIEVGALLGMSTLTIGATEGRYVPFPELYWFTQEQVDNETPSRDCALSEMMKHPMEFDKWYKDNIYSSK